MGVCITNYIADGYGSDWNLSNWNILQDSIVRHSHWDKLFYNANDWVAWSAGPSFTLWSGCVPLVFGLEKRIDNMIEQRYNKKIEKYLLQARGSEASVVYCTL